ncbi:hypothetical protein PVAND_001787 [Polypedilum vanderplanki]|uniref:Choline/carnitine acyltransferase domain-containing protein n=1 Tax=Polypedilum vanderplanki TaxID=319348 RepID=A0A9J6BPA4_POLVA|nr:hypothetical protein PVAND_001787 [Polypedilum vanderplanki]
MEEQLNKDNNGWKEQILSLPKKWLSQASDTDEYGFPDQLPKVPVPPLEQTMTEYLKALKPIVTAQQYEKTKNIIKLFSVHPGPKYHDYLVEKREAEDNWVSF